MPESHVQKHLTVRNFILGGIRSGRLRPGDKAPSEYALAQRFKINKTTCNKAVSMLVEDGYLERRKGAGTFVIDEYAKVAPAIGVFINLRPGSFFSHMLIGIQEEAAARGYSVSFFQAPSGETDMERFRRHITSTGIKGLIINRPFVKPMPGMQNLYLNTSVPNEPVNQVQTDDFNAGYLIGRNFSDHGHRHAAFISQDVSRRDLLERARGFQKAMDDEKLKEHSARLHSFSKTEQNLFSVVQRLLRADHRITAIGFDSIHVASEAFRVLKRLHRNVPKDISLAGIGNLEAAEQTMRITTVDQHPLVLGHTAAESLIDLIEGRIKGGVRIIIPVELLHGESISQLKPEKKP